VVRDRAGSPIKLSSFAGPGIYVLMTVAFLFAEDTAARTGESGDQRDEVARTCPTVYQESTRWC
jgi:hypothetical protein